MSEIHPSHSPELSAGLPSPQPGDGAHSGGLAADPAAAPKPRKKCAPRPTYDDGALTRVFKFPSKKYPKSSYYVTDTEIIIRIRKARKKWKLVVPKKRVVSCRTNRWFTKPRWIEIELTYTQAVRQGLIERTPQPVQAEAPIADDIADAVAFAAGGEGASIGAPAGNPPEQAALAPESDAELDSDDESDVDAEGDEVTGWVPDDDVDPAASEELADADDEDFADEPIDEVVATPSFEWETRGDDDAAAPPLRAWVEAIQPHAPHADATPDHAEALAAALPPVAARMPASRRRRFAGAGLLAAGLAVAILAFSADRWNLADTVADRGPCAIPVHVSCADHGIVTGSVSTAQAPAVATAVQEPAVAEPAGHAPPTQVVAALDSETDVRVAPPPLPIDEAPRLDARADAPPAAAVDLCPVRAASIARSTVIQFGFASASLPSAGGHALAQLATTLGQCQAVRVIVEGHTDSDGDYYRNQSLSVRRAEAVRQHLVAAGAAPAQLSVVGYGQSRPLAPNDSTANKSRNRRIELVVE